MYDFENRLKQQEINAKLTADYNATVKEAMTK
jgi:hypothetical protein